MDRNGNLSMSNSVLSCNIDGTMQVQDLVSPLDAAPTSTSGRTAQQTQVPVLTCLDDLPQSVLLGLCQAGAAGRMPLTVALASEGARQHAAGLDSMAWRDLVAGMLTQHDDMHHVRMAHACMLATCTAKLIRNKLDHSVCLVAVNRGADVSVMQSRSVNCNDTHMSLQMESIAIYLPCIKFCQSRR